MLFSEVLCSDSLGPDVHVKCCKLRGRIGEETCVPPHWCCCFLDLCHDLSGGFWWNELQATHLNMVVRLDWTSFCCCFSLGEEWGFHTWPSARLVLAASRCSCSAGKARCVRHSNPRGLWTGWKQAPVHSTGMEWAAESTQRSATHRHQKLMNINSATIWKTWTWPTLLLCTDFICTREI